MTQSQKATGSRPVAKETTFLIEVADKDAGLAVMEGARARFIASDPAFMPLDDRHFPDLAALVKAAEALNEKRRSSVDTTGAAAGSSASDWAVA